MTTASRGCEGNCARSGHSRPTVRFCGQLAEAEQDAREAFLGIKVCDPAMGIGSLSWSTRWTTSPTASSERMQGYHDSHPDIAWAWNPIQQLIERVRQEIVAEMAHQGIARDPARLDDTSLLTRLVMKRCIYGVDLNPHGRGAGQAEPVAALLHGGRAAELPGPPPALGQFAIGADVRTVEAAIQPHGGGQFGLFAGPFAGLLDLTGGHDPGGRRRPTPPWPMCTRAPRRIATFQRELTPYKQVLDLWVSQYFGNQYAREFLTLYGARYYPPSRAERRWQTSTRLPSTMPGDYGSTASFHWDLEFPELLVSDGFPD